MPLYALLYSLASAPLFASRPFLAAFVTSLLARFGEHIPWLGDTKVVTALSHCPDWFTSTWTIAILGLLAAAEIASAKSSEVRAALDEFDGLLKSAIALGVAFAVLDDDSKRVLHTIQQQSVVGSIGAVVVAGTVFGCAMLRKGFVTLINDVDAHDDIGLQTLLAWVENVWTVFGLLFLVIFPIAALILSALTTLAIWLLRKRAERLEEESRIPCPACNRRILPHASRCFGCGAAVAAPRRVGLFGQPKAEPAPDLALHRFELIARKRCPDCASRLEKRAVRQPCPACGRTTFATPGEFEQYLAALEARLPKTLLIAFCLSAVPLLGVVPGVVYYRLTLISGLRGYIPPLRGCTTKWIVRLVNFGVIALQPIPILGATILPLMCWSNYAIYRRALTGRAQTDLEPPALTAGSSQPA